VVLCWAYGDEMVLTTHQTRNKGLADHYIEVKINGLEERKGAEIMRWRLVAQHGRDLG